ncbi:MAG: type IV pilus assembly protein PilM [Patescibacteria group bacterium]
MSLFSKQPQKQSYIGLDIGLSGIKLVELQNEKGRARLVTYAYAEMPATTLEHAFTDEIDKVAAFIKKMITTAKCTTKHTVAALPISAVFSSIISVPGANEKEIKDAVQLQAKKLIPVPLEEISLDSKTIDSTDGRGDGGKKITRVLITGAPKALVTQYMDLMKRIGLELISLETEAFAQIRSLIGKDRSSIMVIDIGSMRTNISVIEKGIPFLNRSIATGGVNVTQTISKTLGVPYEQAENMKRDIKSMQAFSQAGDLSPILTTLLKPILDEIRYSFNLYQGQTEDGQQKRIDKIILTGGAALLPRLPEFLTSLMNVNTYLGDPWARVVYPTDLRPVLDEIGPRFSVSIGCAMRDIE